MKKYNIEFKDDNDKLIFILVLIESLFTFCLPAFIAIMFLKKYLSEGTYDCLKGLFNFELLLLLVTIAFTVPVIGWILGWVFGTALVIFNIVIIVLNFIALVQKTEFMIPVFFEFL